MKLRLLDLFSGIGGFSLGLERSGGFETVAFCEIDPFCRRVLKKHWPQVRQYEDVRELTAARLAADGIGVDAICGGFPCQDISTAGYGAGIEGERSGLWKEYARLVSEVRPKFVIVENVAALLNRGLGVVLGDLAAVGYDAEWQCISAAAIGAQHRRDRIWIVAHPHGERLEAFANFPPLLREADKIGGDGYPEPIHGEDIFCGKSISAEMLVSAFVVGSRHAVPNWTHRIKALGNAVVPQIPELIGRAIMEARLSIPNPQPGEQ